MFGNTVLYNLWRRTALRWLRWPSPMIRSTTTRNDVVRGGNARDIRSTPTLIVYNYSHNLPVDYLLVTRYVGAEIH